MKSAHDLVVAAKSRVAEIPLEQAEQAILREGFGLFAAQKLLGHSSPTVTAKYYAAQTELPTLTHVRILG